MSLKWVSPEIHEREREKKDTTKPTYPLKVFILCVIYPCVYFLLALSLSLSIYSFGDYKFVVAALQFFGPRVHAAATAAGVYLHRIWRSVFLYNTLSSCVYIWYSFIFFFYWMCVLSYLGGFVWSLFEGFTPHFSNMLSWLCMYLYNFFRCYSFWSKRDREWSKKPNVNRFFSASVKSLRYNPDLGSIKQRKFVSFVCYCLPFPLSHAWKKGNIYFFLF